MQRTSGAGIWGGLGAAHCSPGRRHPGATPCPATWLLSICSLLQNRWQGGLWHLQDWHGYNPSPHGLPQDPALATPVFRKGSPTAVLTRKCS